MFKFNLTPLKLTISFTIFLMFVSFVIFASGCSRGPVEVPQVGAADLRYTEFNSPTSSSQASSSSTSSLLRIQSLSVRDVTFSGVFKGITSKDVLTLSKEAFQSYLEIPVVVNTEGKNFLDINITEYRDREGSSVGAMMPANVSLEMKVITSRGDKVWEGKFASNEKDVISNLLEESDGRFASGRELLKRALLEGARGFADARLKVFRR